MPFDFFSTMFISSEHCSTFLISSTLFVTHLSSSVRQKAFTFRDKLLYTVTVARRTFCTEKLLDTGVFTQQNFYTQKFLRAESFYTWNRLHRETVTHRSFYTEKLLHRDPCTHRTATESTKPFPVRLCTTRLVRITSQYTL